MSVSSEARYILFFMPRLPFGHRPPEILRTHSDTSCSVGLLWSLIGSFERFILKIHNTHSTHNRKESMIPVGFKAAIPENERPQTRAADRTATGIG